jgi:hypothetical protein
MSRGVRMPLTPRCSVSTFNRTPTVGLSSRASSAMCHVWNIAYSMTTYRCSALSWLITISNRLSGVIRFAYSRNVFPYWDRTSSKRAAQVVLPTDPVTPTTTGSTVPTTCRCSFSRNAGTSGTTMHRSGTVSATSRLPVRKVHSGRVAASSATFPERSKATPCQDSSATVLDRVVHHSTAERGGIAGLAENPTAST